MRNITTPPSRKQTLDVALNADPGAGRLQANSQSSRSGYWYLMTKLAPLALIERLLETPYHAIEGGPSRASHSDGLCQGFIVEDSQRHIVVAGIREVFQLRSGGSTPRDHSLLQIPPYPSLSRMATV